MPEENEIIETAVTPEEETLEVVADETPTVEDETKTVEEPEANSDNPEDSDKDSEQEEEPKVADEAEQFTESPEQPEAVVESEIVDETKTEDTQADEPEIDYETKFNELQENHVTLTSDYEILKGQLAELQVYKRQREEEDLKAKFEGKLSDEEFAQVFTELKDADLTQVEEKLFVLIGKKNFSKQTKSTNASTAKVVIVAPKETEYNPYGNIFD